MCYHFLYPQSQHQSIYIGTGSWSIIVSLRITRKRWFPPSPFYHNDNMDLYKKYLLSFSYHWYIYDALHFLKLRMDSQNLIMKITLRASFACREKKGWRLMSCRVPNKKQEDMCTYTKEREKRGALSSCNEYRCPSWEWRGMLIESLLGFYP